MRKLKLFVQSLALAAVAVPANPVSAQTPLKREVDGLVRQARQQKPKTAKEAAVYLVALTHCHRNYTPEDGPIVREPLRLIFSGRRSDGLFGEDKDVRKTTAWVYQALRDFDATRHAADLSAIRTAFGQRFELNGDTLTRALRPYPLSVGEKLTGVHETFQQLIVTVQSQEAAKASMKQAKAPVSKKFDAFQQKALDWLLTKQNGKGMWLVKGPDGNMVPDPGISALCLSALAAKPKAKRTAKENAILKSGIEFLLAMQKRQKDGSFSSFVPNYVTCAAIMALSRADGIEVDRKAIRDALEKAQKYLLAIQNVEKRDYLRSDRDYGSIGYGGDERGDLSNTQMAIEALRESGIDVQDEAFAKALVYLRRLQNVPGKDGYHGTQTSGGKRVPVVPGTDGGAQYYPGNSPAGYDETSDGKRVPRSYGSMTYALLKCYVLCGLPKNDPRLQAALNWCLSNYTLDVNPGSKPELGEKAKYQGLFYYYLTLARALRAAGVDEVKGRDWRGELRQKLQKLQKPGGFWINEKNSRWWEGMPELCTAYALLALAE